MKPSFLATVGLAGIVASCSATQEIRPRAQDARQHQAIHSAVAQTLPPPRREGYLLPQPDCPLPGSYHLMRAEPALVEEPFLHPGYQTMMVSLFDTNGDGREDVFEFRYIDEQARSLTRPFVYGQVQVLPDSVHPQTLDLTVTIDAAMDCIGGNEQIERRHFDFPQQGPGTPVVPPVDTRGSI